MAPGLLLDLAWRDARPCLCVQAILNPQIARIVPLVLRPAFSHSPPLAPPRRAIIRSRTASLPACSLGRSSRSASGWRCSPSPAACSSERSDGTVQTPLHLCGWASDPVGMQRKQTERGFSRSILDRFTHSLLTSGLPRNSSLGGSQSVRLKCRMGNVDRCSWWAQHQFAWLLCARVLHGIRLPRPPYHLHTHTLTRPRHFHSQTHIAYSCLCMLPMPNRVLPHS